MGGPITTIIAEVGEMGQTLFPVGALKMVSDCPAETPLTVIVISQYGSTPMLALILEAPRDTVWPEKETVPQPASLPEFNTAELMAKMLGTLITSAKLINFEKSAGAEANLFGFRTRTVTVEVPPIGISAGVYTGTLNAGPLSCE